MTETYNVSNRPTSYTDYRFDNTVVVQPIPGLSGYKGPLGDVAGSSGSASHLALLLNSLLPLMPTVGDQDLQAAVLFVNEMLQTLESSTTQNSEKNQSLVQQAAIAEQSAQIADAEAKIAQAAQDDSSKSVWNRVLEIIGIIGAALGLLAGLVLAVVPGGQALAAMLIFSSIMGLSSAINSTVQNETGHGIWGNIILACGGSKDAANNMDMAVSITLAVIGLIAAAVTIVGGIISIGLAAQAIASAVVAASDAAEGAVDTAEAAMEILTTLKSALQEMMNVDDVTFVARLVEKLNLLVQALMQIGSAVATIEAGLLDAESATFKADAKLDQASLEEEQALVNSLDQTIKSVIQAMGQSFKGFEAMFKDIFSMLNSTQVALMSVRFSG